MKRARLLVFGVAIAAAGAAAMLANGMLSRPKTKVVETTVGTVDVLVAKSEIRLGDAVKAADFRWQAWPQEAATAGYITRSSKPDAMADLAGAIARAPFLPGEPIKELKLIKANEGGVLAAILPAGMRAISTKISEDSAAGGFILPNDKVDVLVTRKVRGKDGRQEQTVSDTLFTNVRVLAIGQEIEIKDGKKVATGKTATLELAPGQAQTLALAAAMGDISLTLRSLEDSTNAAGLAAGGEGAFKQSEQSNGVKMLRYGTWSRAYGVN